MDSRTGNGRDGEKRNIVTGYKDVENHDCPSSKGTWPIGENKMKPTFAIYSDSVFIISDRKRPF